MSEFKNFESYQSTDWLEFSALRGIYKYMNDRIDMAVDELVGTVKSPIHVSGEDGRVEAFQLSTDVDPEDDRFGHVLALSPILGSESPPSVSALYAKVDREHRLLAQPSLLITLSKIGVGDKVSVEKNRAVDNDDWQHILRLLEIATLRMRNPELYGSDQRSLNVLVEEYDGVLAYLASEFGDGNQEQDAPLTVLEADLGRTFKDLEGMAPYQGRQMLGFEKEGRRMVVEKDDEDYVVVLLDDKDPSSYRKFVVGAYAEEKMSSKRHHYTFVDEISDEDVATARELLGDSLLMFGDVLDGAVDQINQITIEENKIYRENDEALKGMLDSPDDLFEPQHPIY